MSIQTFLKRPSGLLKVPVNTYTIYRPNRVSGSKPCVSSAFLSHAVLQKQSCFRMSGTTNIRSFATLHGPYRVHSATTMHKLDTQQTRQLSSWDEQYPTVRWIEIKNTDKNADWGNCFEAIVTLHRDKHRRVRRVWTPFSGVQPTEKELAAEWPEDKQARVQRKLRDEWALVGDSSGRKKGFYMVTEKRGVDGQPFWREVIPKGESTAEEEILSWEEWMREEGHWDEIERRLAKEMS